MRVRRTDAGTVRGGDVMVSPVFEGHIVPEPNSGCWLWTGTVSPKGYGIFGNHTQGRVSTLAHILAYTHHRGDVPAGLELDHLCST